MDDAAARLDPRVDVVEPDDAAENPELPLRRGDERDQVRLPEPHLEVVDPRWR